MRRFAFALLVTALTTGWIGCQSATEPATQPANQTATQPATSEVPADSGDSPSSDVVLVSLKVPNMV